MKPVSVVATIHAARRSPPLTTHDHCAQGEGQHQRDHYAYRCRPAQPRGDLGKARALPACERPDSHQEERRRHERSEHGLEIRRTDGELAQAQCVERKRIQRAEEDGPGRDDEQHVVREQHRLARNQR